MRVGVCVLQRQEGVGSDGALALAGGAGQQVVDGDLSGGEGDGGNLGRGGEGLQLLEVLLLLHQLVEQHLLLILRGWREKRIGGGRNKDRGRGNHPTKIKGNNCESQRRLVVVNVASVQVSVRVLPLKVGRPAAAGAAAAAGGASAAPTVGRAAPC